MGGDNLTGRTEFKTEVFEVLGGQQFSIEALIRFQPKICDCMVQNSKVITIWRGSDEVLLSVAIQQVNADCAHCLYGLDLTLAERSIPVFAQTVLANASLVKQYVSGLAGRPAADSVEYEDLWKFTLASYNAGPGCFTIAF